MFIVYKQIRNRRAVSELKELGYEAYAKTCDVSVRSDVRALAAYAAGLGD